MDEIIKSLTSFERKTLLLLDDRPIAYKPLIAKSIKSVKGAILLSQFLYWSRNETSIKRDGWFYKTAKQIYNETGLSEKEQSSARQTLREYYILEELLRGLPATKWYRINYKKLVWVIDNFAPKYEKIDEENKFRPLGETGFDKRGKLYTESTTDTLSKDKGWDKPTKPNIIPLKDDVFGKKYGSREVNTVLDAISKLTPTGKLDSSDAENRRRAQNLIKKYGLDEVLKTIKLIPDIPFWSDKITSAGALLKHYNAIIISKPIKKQQYRYL